MYKRLQKLLAGLVLAMTASVSQSATPDGCYIGEIFMFAGNYAPTGTALANGQLLPINQNTPLFSLLGTTYGGNGTTNFALPDLRGRAPVSAGQGAGLSNITLGQQRGSESATPALATTSVIPTTRAGNTTVATAASPIATIPPQLGINYVICLQGIYPSRP